MDLKKHFRVEAGLEASGSLIIARLMSAALPEWVR